MLPGLRGGFCLTLLSEADRPVQTLKRSEAEQGAELESFSCQPADVPHPHILMAFYGSLESLWLLLTQWDSLQRQRGLQREGQPQYIADAKIFNLRERRHCLASEEILSFELLDSIWNVSLFFLMLCHLGLYFCFMLSNSYVRAL